MWTGLCLSLTLFVDHMQSGWPFFWSFFVSFCFMVEDLGLHATLDLGLPTCITHSHCVAFCMSRLHCIIEFPLGSQRRLSYIVIPCQSSCSKFRLSGGSGCTSRLQFFWRVQHLFLAVPIFGGDIQAVWGFGDVQKKVI